MMCSPGYLLEWEPEALGGLKAPFVRRLIALVLNECPRERIEAKAQSSRTLSSLLADLWVEPPLQM